MEQIFQAQNVQYITLQGTKAIILTKGNESNQRIVIFESNTLIFREFLISNYQNNTPTNLVSIACDPNLAVVLMFEELKSLNETQIYHANLEKSFTPISVIKVSGCDFQIVEWFNSYICAIVFQNELLLYNIQQQNVFKNIKADFNQISLLKINNKFDTILCQYNNKNLSQQCTLRKMDNFQEIVRFDHSISCVTLIKETEKVIILKKEQNQFKLLLLDFDTSFQIQTTINQTQLQAINDYIIMIYHRTIQNDLLLLDQNQNLCIYSLDSQFVMKKNYNIPKVLQFVVSIRTHNLIYLDQFYNYYHGVFDSSLNLMQQSAQKEQKVSVNCQSKILAKQGILSKQNYQSTEEILQKYQKEFKLMSPKFSEIIKLNNKFSYIPLIDFRVLVLPKVKNEDYQEYIPNMNEYIPTPGVKNHLKKFEIIFKGDNAILCEGPSASGKTSIIQYLAHEKKKPLKIMNLNSCTQITDFIGKIEILPGFKLEFKPGPFTEAVQEGFWLLLDDANLASDSILRVIEDVLELGYFTIFGNQINSHVDIVDGVLTIRRHQNFKLFLTQNPATDSKFASSRNVFSASLMSQFIVLKFQSMDQKDLQSIVHSLIQKNLNNIADNEKKQQLSILIMNIYLEIKANQLDDDLFTLRDILHIIDVISLPQQKENILEILPINYCLKLIIIQFLDMKKNLSKVYQFIEEFQNLGYSNDNFEQTQNERMSLYSQSTQKLSINYLSFHSCLFPLLTMCYKTKRPALIVGQQFCGKLSSVKLWLEIFEMKQYEFFELFSDTTNEDLFGKYQLDKEGFIFKEGPVTRCFSEGKILILTNIDAPDQSLIESLNGILEKNQKQLLVQNKKYERNDNFTIFAISSNILELERKFSRGLRNKFLIIPQDFSLTKMDIAQLFESIGMPKDQLFVNTIFQELENKKEDKNEKISFNRIIRFLKPIKEFIKFSKQNLQKQNSQQEIIEMVTKCIDFFIALSKQDSYSLYKELISLPITFDELWEKKEISNNKKFIFTPSRKRISDILAFAVAAKVPLLLQGSAGVGKTKIIQTISQTFQFFQETSFHYINMNQNTDINDLMGQYVVSYEGTERKFIFKKGPLYLGMESGGIVFIDEINLSEPSILNFLSTISKYPEEFIDPVSSNKIVLHDKFRIFFAQNPPQFIGRSMLPQCLTAKVIIIHVPNYTLKEVLEICQGQSSSVKSGMEYFLKKIIKYPEDGNENSLKVNDTQFTLRQFLKLQNRLDKTNFQINNNWDRIIKLHQMILYPMNQQDSDSLVCQYQLVNSEIVIQIKNLNTNDFVEVKLPLKNQINKCVIEKLESLNQLQTLILGKITFCYYFKENVLLEGKTASKTYIAQLFSEIIQFKNPNPFEVIYITNCTQYADLVGNIESHNEESYGKYIQNLITKIAIQTNGDANELKPTLDQLQQDWNMKEFFKEIENNKINQFPFVERGITIFARFGGVICLKNITLADQTVLEGLNSLLELEPQFIVNGKIIPLHQEFFVIALLNITYGGQVSEAMQSRFTRIFINQSEYLNKKKQITEECKKYIKAKLQEDENEVCEFVQSTLNFLQQKHPKIEITDRNFYNWMSFLDLNIPSSNIEKLALGLQFVVLDQYNQQFEKIFENQPFLGHYKTGEENFLNSLKLNNLTKSPKLILNTQTQKIMLRIFSSFSTKYIPCLVGPPGVGKSAIAQEIAKIKNKKFCRVCCSDSLSIEDLFGSYAPIISQNSSGFIFKEGFLQTALKEQSIILFDEVNLASPDVLSTLQALFNTSEKYLKIKDFIINKENCVFLCSMNPPSYQGRQQLPQCISSLLSQVYIEQFNIDEVLNIFSQSYQKEIENLREHEIDFKIILKLHKELAESSYHDQQSNYDFNIRFLQNLLQLFNPQFLEQKNQISDPILQQELVVTCLEIIYVDHFYFSANSKNNLGVILKHFNLNQEEWEKRKIFIEQKANIIQIQKYQSSQLISFLNYPIASQIPFEIASNNLILNLKNSKIILKILISLQSKKVILCQGETATGKTSTMIKLANILNQRFILLPINCELEVDDLLGNFNFVQNNYEEIQKGLENIVQGANIQKTQEIIKEQRNMKFLDGVLKICLQNGYWLILDNINLARAEIIERLKRNQILSLLLFIIDAQKLILKLKLKPINMIFKKFQSEVGWNNKFFNKIMQFQHKNFQSKLILLEIILKFKQIQDRLIQANGFHNYLQVMEIIFGKSFKESKQLKQLSGFDNPLMFKIDEILNQLVANSLIYCDDEMITQMKEVKNLFEIFEKFLGEKYFKNYKYFIEQFSNQIYLQFNQQNLNIKDEYDFIAFGKLRQQLCSYDFEIFPTGFKIQLRNKVLITFLLRIECKFLKQQFLAEIKLNKEKQMSIQFNKSRMISIVQMIEQIVNSQNESSKNLFNITKAIIEQASYECQIVLEEQQQLIFNLQLEEFVFQQFSYLRLKNIQGFLFQSDANFRFYFVFDLALHNFELGKVTNFVTGKERIKLKTEQLFELFKGYSCYYFLSNIDLVPFEDISYLDLEQKMIEINLSFLNSLEIFNFPMLLKVNQIKAQIQLSDQYKVQGQFICTLQLCKKDICVLKTQVDNSSKNIFQLKLDEYSPKTNLQNLIPLFLEQYFVNTNYFIKRFTEIKQMSVQKIDIVTNSIFWNMLAQIEFNRPIFIEQNIQLDFKFMQFQFHLGSKIPIFNIIFVIEIFKCVLVMKVEIDFATLLSKTKLKELKMSLIKFQTTPKFSEILHSYSGKIDSVLKKIQGYDELKLKEKFSKDFIQKQNPNPSLDENNLKKFTYELISDFETYFSQMQIELKEQNISIKAYAEKKKQQIRDQYKKYSQETVMDKQRKRQDEESFVDWDEQCVKFNLNASIIDKWQIYKFMALSICDLKISNLDSNCCLVLSGQVLLMNIPLTKFNLNFSSFKPLQIRINDQCLEKSLNPLTLAFSLFDQSFDDIDIFPKIQQIKKLFFCFESYSFECLLFSEESINNYKEINFRSLNLNLKYQQNCQQIQAVLISEIIIFGVFLELKLDFYNQLIENKGNNGKLILESNSIKNFEFNQLVKSILDFRICEELVSFSLEKLKCSLIFEKNINWLFTIQFEIFEGNCKLFNIISLQKLEGQICYAQNQQNNINFKGECFIFSQLIGQFNLRFQNEDKRIEIKIQPSAKFNLAELIEIFIQIDMKELLGTQLILKNLEIYSEISELSLKFWTKYKLKDSFYPVQFIGFSLIYCIFKMEQIKGQQIEYTLKNEFKIDIFGLIVFNTSFELPQHKHIVIKKQFDLSIPQLLYYLRQYNIVKIPDIPFLKKTSISIEFVITLKHDFTLIDSEFFVLDQIYKEWCFVTITQLSIMYSQSQNQFKLEGHLKLFQLIEFYFEFDQQELKLKFQPIQQNIKIQQVFKNLHFEEGQLEMINKFNFVANSDQLNGFDLDVENQLIYLQCKNLQVAAQYQDFGILFYYSQIESFSQISSYFSFIDNFFKINKADCLIVSQNINNPMKIDQKQKCSKYYSEAIKGRIKKFHFYAEIEVEASNQMKKYFEFLENKQKLFCQVTFDENIIFSTNYIKIFYKKVTESECEICYNLLAEIPTNLNEIKNTVFRMNLNIVQLKSHLQLIGSFEIQTAGKIEGELQLKLNNAFGLENFNLNGELKITNVKRDQIIESNLKTIICSCEVDLYIMITLFKAKGFGFLISNINLYNFLKYFSLHQYFHPSFFYYIPEIKKLGFILGEIIEDLKYIKEKVYKYFQKKNRFFGRIFENFKHEITFTQILIAIESSSASKKFVFNFILGNENFRIDQVGFFLIGKLKLKINSDFCFSTKLYYQISNSNHCFDQFGKIIVFGTEFFINVSFHQNLLTLQTDLQYNDWKFQLSLKGKLQSCLSFQGELKYEESKDSIISHRLFRFVQIQYLQIVLNIEEEIQAQFEYSIRFCGLKEFRNKFEITFNLKIVQESILQLFKKIESFFSLFSKNLRDEKEFQTQLVKNAKEVQKQCWLIFEVDVSDDLEQLKQNLGFQEQNKFWDLLNIPNQIIKRIMNFGFLNLNQTDNQQSSTQLQNKERESVEIQNPLLNRQYTQAEFEEQTFKQQTDERWKIGPQAQSEKDSIREQQEVQENQFLNQQAANKPLQKDQQNDDKGKIGSQAQSEKAPIREQQKFQENQFSNQQAANKPLQKDQQNDDKGKIGSQAQSEKAPIREQQKFQENQFSNQQAANKPLQKDQQNDDKGKIGSQAQSEKAPIREQQKFQENQFSNQQAANKPLQKDQQNDDKGKIGSQAQSEKDPIRQQQKFQENQFSNQQAANKPLQKDQQNDDKGKIGSQAQSEKDPIRQQQKFQEDQFSNQYAANKPLQKDYQNDDKGKIGSQAQSEIDQIKEQSKLQENQFSKQQTMNKPIQNDLQKDDKGKIGSQAQSEKDPISQQQKFQENQFSNQQAANKPLQKDQQNDDKGKIGSQAQSEKDPIKQQQKFQENQFSNQQAANKPLQKDQQNDDKGKIGSQAQSEIDQIKEQSKLQENQFPKQSIKPESLEQINKQNQSYQKRKTNDQVEFKIYHKIRDFDIDPFTMDYKEKLQQKEKENQLKKYNNQFNYQTATFQTQNQKSQLQQTQLPTTCQVGTQSKNIENQANQVSQSPKDCQNKQQTSSQSSLSCPNQIQYSLIGNKSIQQEYEKICYDNPNFVIPQLKMFANNSENYQNSKLNQQIIENIEQQKLQNQLSYDSNFYDAYIRQVEQHLFLLWSNQQSLQDIQIFTGSIVINFCKPDQQQLEYITKLLIQLYFLHQKFEVILSGSIKAIVLKKMDDELSFEKLDEILHALYGKCKMDFENAKIDQIPLDFIIVLDDNERGISQQCKIELQQSNLKSICICLNGSMGFKNIETNEKSNGMNIFQLLLQTKSHPKELLQSKQFDTSEQPHKIKLTQNFFEDFELHQQKSNGLKKLLEVNKYTKYSLSSKGTTIDIKGIIKFYCTNGTAKDIMKKKNRGGISLYLFQVWLDLSCLSQDQIRTVIKPFLQFIIKFCYDAKIVCNLVIINKDIIIAKSNFVTSWSEKEVEILMEYLCAKCNFKLVYNSEFLKQVIVQLEKYNSYKKFIFFINHQFYNYSNQNCLTILKLARERQIVLISFGIGLQKYTNSSIQEVIHFELKQENNFYDLLQQILDKKYPNQLKILNLSKFMINSKQYSRNLATANFQSQSYIVNSYLNKHFNYITQALQKEKILFNYQQIFPQSNVGGSVVFNFDSTKLFFGEKVIKVYNFYNGKIQEIIQTLTNHENYVDCMLYLNNSNFLISGSWDSKIIIWKEDQNSKWQVHQTLRSHDSCVCCLVKDQSESLVISGSRDETIKFWNFENMNWICCQTIKAGFGVLSLSLNGSSTKLISCGFQNEIIIIDRISQFYWMKIQTIKIDSFGQQLCFINNDQFVFQSMSEFLDIYIYEKNQNKFKKSKQVPVQTSNNSECFLFPCRYVESKNILGIRNGCYANFFSIDGNQNCILLYTIKFSSKWWNGIINNEGQFFATGEGVEVNSHKNKGD